MQASDNFDRADDANLATGGFAWADQTAQTSLQIITNSAQATDTSTPQGNRRTEVWLPNQSARATIKNGSGSWREASVRVRCQAGAQSYYAGGLDNFALGSQHFRIWKVVAGTPTNLILHGSQDAALNDVIWLRIVENVLSLYVNFIQILSVADATFADGTPGLGAFTGVNPTDAWDDFFADEITGVGIPKSINPHAITYRPRAFAPGLGR